MQERHRDRQKYFEEQSLTTLRHVVPYLKQSNSLAAGMRILEIGCGEGGNLAPLLDLGCEVVGVDYVASRIALAEKQFEQHPLRNKLTLEVADIYDWNPERPIFDLIIMRDVIEHIHDQERFMEIVKRFMHSKSHFFLAFPPWQNPFGGHQQICSNRWLSKLPYYQTKTRPVSHPKPWMICLRSKRQVSLSSASSAFVVLVDLKLWIERGGSSILITR
jgi:2-polyprenyl-3-methyl-5-hydroxy-6-metoxy-1,4-benzoquinol methylase